MQYKILKTYTLARLENDIKDHLNDGWKLAGSLIAFEESPNSYYFAQPMTKDEEQIIEEPKKKKEQITYMIGQRVIYNNAICTICNPEKETSSYYDIWLDNPSHGYKHFVDAHNIKPLPGGQL